MTARKSKNTDATQQTPILTADEAQQGLNAPAPIEQATGKAATPEAKEKARTKLHWVSEGAERTLCGIYHLDPRMTAAEQQEEVTCAVCLKVLSGPREGKAPKGKAERVTIQCATCGKDHEIYAYQQGIVTRDPVCQKKYRRSLTRDKRKGRNKARRAERKLSLQTDITGKLADAQALLMGADKAMLMAVIQTARTLLKG